MGDLSLQSPVSLPHPVLYKTSDVGGWTFDLCLGSTGFENLPASQ